MLVFALCSNQEEASTMQRAISMLGLFLALTGLIGVCEAFVPGVRQVGAQAGVRTMAKR
jgi:hypothetical protein